MTVPSTSLEAYRDIRLSGIERSHRITVMMTLDTYPGLTSAEIPLHCGLDLYQVRRRLSDMLHVEHVQKSTDRECSVCNRRCNTWELTSKGLAELDTWVAAAQAQDA